MKSRTNDRLIIFIRHNELKKAPITHQTQNMRDNINSRIRYLGKKFYEVKKIFEQMNIHRDILFQVGKDLEKEFQDIKVGIKLAATSRRMKEALLCWFCDYFYDEIITPNSPILIKLKAAQLQYDINVIQNKIKSSSSVNTIPKTKVADTGKLRKKQKKSEKRNSFALQLKANEEIDNFNFSNIYNDNSDEENSSVSENFVYNFNF